MLQLFPLGWCRNVHTSLEGFKNVLILLWTALVCNPIYILSRFRFRAVLECNLSVRVVDCDCVVSSCLKLHLAAVFPCLMLAKDVCYF